MLHVCTGARQRRSRTSGSKREEVIDIFKTRMYLWARTVLPLLGLFAMAKGHGSWCPGFFDGDG